VSSYVIENAHVVTWTAVGPVRRRHVVVEGDRVTAVGGRRAPSGPAGARRVDAGGCLVTPGS